MLEVKNTHKSLLKALQIFNLYSSGMTELSVAEVAREIGVSVSTAYRILTTFTASGLLEKNVLLNKYLIGPKMYSLGIQYLNKTNLLREAEPVIKLLNELTEESVNVATFDEGKVIYIMHAKSHHFLSTNMYVGSIIAAHSSALGRSFLSELTDKEIDNLYPEELLKQIGPKTVKNKAELKRRLQQIRETGVSFDSEGTFEGIDGIATLIRGMEGKGVAALGIVLPALRMNKGKRKLYEYLLKMGANLISYRLGFKETSRQAPSIEEIRSWWNEMKVGKK